jgi:tripartite-type tricarboxylate transporter receptor subunit TctC
MKKLILFWLVCTVCFITAANSNSTYPNRPVEIYVGVMPGGTQDISTRALVEETSFDQPIVVVNRPGGGGMGVINLTLISKTKPDGYILGMSPQTGIIDEPLIRKLPYDFRSFTPVVSFALANRQALLVNKRWKTFEEFITYAKNHRVTYSTTGVGSPLHIVMEVIAKKEGIQWTHIPFKGNSPALVALMGGHVDACSSGSEWPQYVESGMASVVAVYSRKRLEAYPNVPTLEELGYDYSFGGYFFILGPANLPLEIITKLENSFIPAAKRAKYSDIVERIYLTPVSMNSRECMSYLNTNWDKMKKIYKDLNLHLE